eukprot:scaffold82123_cov73-Attheya_sp.AAC.2
MSTLISICDMLTPPDLKLYPYPIITLPTNNISTFSTFLMHNSRKETPIVICYDVILRVQ